MMTARDYTHHWCARRVSPPLSPLTRLQDRKSQLISKRDCRKIEKRKSFDLSSIRSMKSVNWICDKFFERLQATDVTLLHAVKLVTLLREKNKLLANGILLWKIKRGDVRTRIDEREGFPCSDSFVGLLARPCCCASDRVQHRPNSSTTWYCVGNQSGMDCSWGYVITNWCYFQRRSSTEAIKAQPQNGEEWPLRLEKSWIDKRNAHLPTLRPRTLGLSWRNHSVFIVLGHIKVHLGHHYW